MGTRGARKSASLFNAVPTLILQRINKRNRRQWLVTALIGFITFGVGLEPLSAQNQVDLFYGYYKDDNRLTVNTPSVQVSHDPRENITLSAKYTFERFEKAAPAAAHSAADDNAEANGDTAPAEHNHEEMTATIDAVSGASTVVGGVGTGFKEDRHEGVISGSYRKDLSTWALGLFASEEDDFSSKGFSAAVSREFFDRNFTITGLYGISLDQIDKLQKSSFEHYPKDKTTHGVTLAATQLLDPRSLVTGGYAFAYSDGFLSNPTRQIRVGDVFATIEDERHPKTRARHTVFLRGKRYFLTRSAADFNLSYYRDDWGVSAAAADLHLSQYLNDRLIVRLRHRFYRQGAADFYKAAYLQRESIMTADARLRHFDSHLSGISLTYSPYSLRENRWSIWGGYDHYRETNNGLTADIFKIGLSLPY